MFGDGGRCYDEESDPEAFREALFSPNTPDDSTPSEFELIPAGQGVVRCLRYSPSRRGPDAFRDQQVAGDFLVTLTPRAAPAPGRDPVGDRSDVEPERGAVAVLPARCLWA